MKVISSALCGLFGGLLLTMFKISTLAPPDLASRHQLPWQPNPQTQNKMIANATEKPIHPEALSRPLFRSTRRPFDPTILPIPIVQELPPIVAEPAPPPPPPDASQISLKGIIQTEGIKRALVATPEAPDGIWLTKGETVNGWLIINIGSDLIAISAGGQTLERKLYVDNAIN
jgi:hypothetical protein